MRRRVLQFYIKKNDEVIFSLAWNIMFTDNQKVLVLHFLEMENVVFLTQKVDGKMIFTNYWKVLFLIFSGMGNTVFFYPKSLWKDNIYWLLKISFFELFGMANTVFFWVKKLMERWYLLRLFEISMIFQDLENMVFRAV